MPPIQKKGSHMIRAILITLGALALLMLAACERNGAELIAESENPTTLRAYTVPSERLNALQAALRTVLGDKGGVSIVLPDQILVLAPAVLQSSIASTLRTLAEGANSTVAEPTKSAPIQLQVWVVDVSETASEDPRLAPIKAALDAIRDSLAAPGFVLQSHLLVNGSMGSDVRSGDRNANVYTRMTATNGGVKGRLQLSAGAMAIDTDTELRFGQVVVLAQATPEDDGRARVRLMIVRADPAI